MQKQHAVILSWADDVDGYSGTKHRLIDGLEFDPNSILTQSTITGVVYLGTAADGSKIIIKPPIDIKKLMPKIKKECLDSCSTSYFDNTNSLSTHRESAAYILFSKFFGLDFIPETELFVNPFTHQVMSAQKFIENSVKFEHHEQLKQYKNSDIIFKLAIIDTILGNNDRNKGNVLISDGKIHLIDNAFIFDYINLVRTKIPSYSKHLLRYDVPQSVFAWGRNLNVIDISNIMTDLRIPSDLVFMVFSRMNEFFNWLDIAEGNKGFSRNLGNLLEILRCFCFTDAKKHRKNVKKRDEVYRRSRRGCVFEAQVIGSDDETCLTDFDNSHCVEIMEEIV